MSIIERKGVNMYCLTSQTSVQSRVSEWAWVCTASDMMGMKVI